MSHRVTVPYETSYERALRQAYSRTPGVCYNCAMTVIGYTLLEFWDEIIKTEGAGCPYCGEPDFRHPDHR